MNSVFQSASPLIAPAKKAASTENIHIFYRARFTLPEDFSDPVLRFYATSTTEVALNGKTLHYGPCRNCPPVLFYDQLLPELKAGENLLALHQCVDREKGEFGVLVELEIVTGSGKKFLLGDASCFETGYFQSYRFDAPLNSGTGYAEYIDFSLREERWRDGIFPDGILPARPTRLKVPQGAFELRPIPLFEEKTRTPLKITIEEDGSVLADFGRLHCGRVELSGTAIDTVIVEYIEAFDSGWSLPYGTPVMYDDRLENLRGTFVWKSHHKRAGRYIRVRGVKREDFRLMLREYSYPVEETGSFDSSDPLLNQLFTMSAETLKLCMEDIYTDCPHRDQEQWMDALISSRAALGLFGVRDLTRKCLRQYAAGLRSDGQLYSPSICGTGAVPDYTLLFFPFLLHYYKSSGDRELLVELYPVLERILAGMKQQECVDGLLHIEADAPDFVYLDNTFELAKRGTSTGLNMLYFKALSDFEEISALLGKPVTPRRSEALRAVIKAKLSHPEKANCFVDNLICHNRKFLTVNFSCELGSWSGKIGVLEFELFVENSESIILEVADYAGFKLYCNGEILKDNPRIATWSREPMYQPEKVELSLASGVNRIRFEVPWSHQNWELFLRRADGGDFRPHSAMAGEQGTPLRPIRLRHWQPPFLSQSTQAYAAFAGIHRQPEETLDMLKQTLRGEYPRVYKSVRVPFFCTEAGAAREQDPWVMPCNTPWPTFYLLGGLFENGGGIEALQVIRQYWRDMAAHGDRTTSEEWGRRSSLCHAWGASIAYFMQHDILGVKHETLCGENLLIRPNLCGLVNASGRIAVDTDCSVWIALRRNGKVTTLTVYAPDHLSIDLDVSLLGECEITGDSRFSRTLKVV